MTGLPLAAEDPKLIALAQTLGLEDLVVYDRDHGQSPLIHARYNGALVAISQRTGIAGGIGVAFYGGQVEADWDDEEPADQDTPAGAETVRLVAEWDEIVDSTWPDPEAALIMAAAILQARGKERAERYKGLQLGDRAPEPDPGS